MNETALRIQLLGEFRLWVGENAIDPRAWRLRKARTLIKLLALAPGHQLHREQLMNLLWPELPPEAAANNLHQALHVARRALSVDAPQRPFLQLRDDTISLDPEGPTLVDVEAFEAAVSAARRDPDLEAIRSALALVGGELLPEDRYEDWASPRREALIADEIRLRLALAQRLESQGEFGEAVDALRHVLERDGTLEEAHVGLMRQYALSGQRHLALRQFQDLRAALERELAAEPAAASWQLYQAILAERFPEPAAPQPGPACEPRTVAAPGPARHVLPTTRTSFIGRVREIEAVTLLLAADSRARLVTLTGEGGSGKTRLALRVAQDLLDRFPDGVWFVDLAPLRDPAHVMATLLSTLGQVRREDLAPQDVLNDFLRDKHALLILDNCEHLVEATAEIADALLRACPRLVLLATSRETLAVAGEALYRVPTLSTPDPQRWALAELPDYDAVRLFVARAQDAGAGYALTAENAAGIVRICACLDGIPLAIELAAARTAVLGADQIAEHLDDRFRLLRSGQRGGLARHQTLQALIDWSHALLAEPERQLLRRLAVFAGGWTLDAAQAVCESDVDDGYATLEALTQLVNKSLISFAHEPERRYRMSETIRQYASARLWESGEAEDTQRRHLRYFVDLAQRAEPHLRGADMLNWLDRLDAELDNLRAALKSALEYDAGVALRFATSLLWFWHIRNHRREGTEWLQRALAFEAAQRGARPADPTEALQRGRGLNALGSMLVFSFKTPQARSVLEEGRALVQALGSAGHNTLAYIYIRLARLECDYAAARAYLDQSLIWMRAAGDGFGEAECLMYLAVSESDAGLYTEALALANEARMASTRIGDIDGLATIHQLSGYIRQSLHDRAGAQADFERSLALFDRVGNTEKTGTVSFELGGVWFWAGDFERARLCWAGDRVGRLAAHDPNNDGFSADRLFFAALLAWVKGDRNAASADLELSIDFSRKAAAWPFWMGSQHLLGCIALATGDGEIAERWFRAEWDTARGADFAPGMAFANCGLSRVALDRGDLDLADHYACEALNPERPLEKHLTPAVAAVVQALLSAGRVALARGDLAGATERLVEAARLQPVYGCWPYGPESHPKAAFARLTESLARVAASRAARPAPTCDDPERAARLLGASAGLHDYRYAMSRAERDAHDRTLAAVQAALGAEAFARAWESSRSLTVEAAARLCIDCGATETSS